MSKPYTHNPAEEVELARISMETAQAAAREAERAYREAVRESQTIDAVLATVSPETSDEDLVEELHDEGFDYETAEAIVRWARHDWQTRNDVRDMTDEALMAERPLASFRVQCLIDAETTRREYLWD